MFGASKLHGACVLSMLTLVALCPLLFGVQSAPRANSTDIVAAIRTKNLVSLKSLVRTKAAANQALKRGGRPLYLVSAEGDLAAAQYLLSLGADPNLTDRHGFAPLSAAVFGSHPALVRLMLSHGANVNHQDFLGGTALTSAWVPSIARILLAHGAAVNTHMSDGQTPLHAFASERLPDLVRLLISKGAEVDATDNGGRTPLAYAVAQAASELASVRATIPDMPAASAKLKADGWNDYRKDCLICRILVEHGADPNHRCKNGESPRSMAHKDGLTYLNRLFAHCHG